jgi:hypothetical protein
MMREKGDEKNASTTSAGLMIALPAFAAAASG